MDKLLNIISQLEITKDYMSREINEIEFLSSKISEFDNVYKRNCDEFQTKSDEIENLKAEEISLYNKITDREKELAEAMTELKDLQTEFDSVSKYECYFDWTGRDFAENTELKMKLYGIKIEAQYLEPSICQAKVIFASDRFVTFNVDIVQNTYDLQEMEPKLRHYEEIRALLLESGDISGFLCHVWKFFSRII